MRAAEEAAFARGVSADVLMEEAGEGIARSIQRFFPRPGKCVVFAGKGHNAGDAFVAARRLAQAGWKIEPRLAYPEEELVSLTSEKLLALRAISQNTSGSGPTILLDGLLGLGAKPPLREPIRSLCRELNARRDEGEVVGIDLPSGLDGDSGAADDDCVIADFTITIGFAKSGVVADAALDFVGRLKVIPLQELRWRDSSSQEELAIPEALRGLLPRRKYSAYKNQFGRVGILAGSRGFTGAALMCSLGALRAGAGLVELFVPEEIYEIVATAAAPEVMVKPVVNYEKLLAEKIDVWAIGPGLGQSRTDEVTRLIRDAKQPVVVDADGLNILSEKISILLEVAGPRLLTPHPGEMERLFPIEKKSRADWATKFCEKYEATLLLKGSRTIVAERGRALSYNTTGTPGMATGGMGDVLTGVCGGLLGQKLSPNDAARLGAWLCGRAAEVAISTGSVSEESLLPTDVLAHLGAAFGELREF
jgi:NAD(P)H-hydrate epimerase